MRPTTVRSVVFIVALAGAGVGGAEAGAPLSTGHLLVESNQYMRCIISNLSAKDLVVDKVESVDALGNVSQQRTTFTLAPGATEPNIFVFSSARCVFTLKKRKLVRAYACVSTLASALCLTESEAR